MQGLTPDARAVCNSLLIAAPNAAKALQLEEEEEEEEEEEAAERSGSSRTQPLCQDSGGGLPPSALSRAYLSLSYSYIQTNVVQRPGPAWHTLLCQIFDFPYSVFFPITSQTCIPTLLSHTHTHTHTRTHTHTHTHAHAHARTCTKTDTHAHTDTRAHEFTP